MLLHTGIPIEKPALGVNRLCGSGFQAVVNCAQDIVLGAARIALAGGVDNMSQSPFIVRNVRFGTTLGANYTFEDSLWVIVIFGAHEINEMHIHISCVLRLQKGVSDSYCKSPMAITAENLADKFKIPRAKVDEFSLRSQQLWKKAQDAGVYATEIAPYKLTVRGKDVDFAIDEHPK